MERSMVAFNLPNFFTVVIMASIGYGLLALIAQLLMRRSASSGSVGG